MNSNPGLPKRAIRSFVLRAGRMTAGQERALRELWPRFGIENDAGPLDLDAIFGRRAPRVLEIGFGTGDALIAYADQHRDHDCLGVEVHRPGVGHLLLRADQLGLTNVRALCHDAVDVISNRLPRSSLSEVHIFFPDPWHKKRHHKRRLIQAPFLDVLARVMAPGALLKLATDWEHYAQQMLAELAAHPDFDNAAAASDGFAERAAHRPLTRFENRGHRLGHGVWDLCFRRVGPMLGGRPDAPTSVQPDAQPDVQLKLQ